MREGFAISGAFVLLVLAAAVLLSRASSPQEAPQASTSTVTIGATTVAVEVADTDDKRAQGLSGRAALAEGVGMLFVFDTEDAWGIWMKDMRFPIDIIWADTNGTILTIKRGATPESYPEVFYPANQARYVLEVPAGFSGAHGIAEGQKIVVEYK